MTVLFLFYFASVECFEEEEKDQEKGNEEHEGKYEPGQEEKWEEAEEDEHRDKKNRIRSPHKDACFLQLTTFLIASSLTMMNNSKRG